MPDNNGTAEKTLPEDAVAKTVQIMPAQASAFAGDTSATMFWIGQQADEMEPWGRSVKLRDRQLREFIPVEPYFNSALAIITARNAAFSWKLEGPPRQVTKFQKILQTANFGKGWAHFVAQVSVDLYTQDSGAFIEIIRAGNKESDEVVGIAHLDSNRCYPTGDPEVPVVYTDRQGQYHWLKWYQVVQILEIPAAWEGLPGLQYCALTRMLRAVKIARDISIYLSEKIGGRNPRSVTAVKGITANQMNDAMTQARNLSDAQGLLRFSQPIIVGAVDPKSDVGFATLELASIPDGFNLDATNRWYITQIAMAFLTDYQDFAPMPGSGLGTATQSEVLHMKTRGKGPGLFMKIIAEAMNWAILPDTLEFYWDEQDAEQAKIEADSALVRAQSRAERLKSGEISPLVAQDIAHQSGDLTEAQLTALQGMNLSGSEATAGPFERESEILNEGASAEAQNAPAAALPAAPAAAPTAQPAKPPVQAAPGRYATLLGIKANDRAGGGEVSQARLDVEDDVAATIEEAFTMARDLLLRKVEEDGV